jgi:hypothetical protein
MEKAQKLKHLGLENLGRVYWNLPTPALYEEAIRRYEGMLSHLMFQRNFTENAIEPPAEIKAVGPRSKSGGLTVPERKGLEEATAKSKTA